VGALFGDLAPPDGTVIVPTDNANETAVGAFHSTNGGASWSSTTTFATISSHTVAGSLRTGPLPSAEIDGAGVARVYWDEPVGDGNDIPNDNFLTRTRSFTVLQDTNSL
jgi:hypothetical protein